MWRRQCTGAQAVRRSCGLRLPQGEWSGRGAFPGRGSHAGKHGGGQGRANAGMSSVKADEKSAHRQPKGSYGRVIRVGLGGPKPRAQAVGDGQPVSIPAPPTSVEAPVTPSGKFRVPTGQGAFLPRGLFGGEGGGRSGDFGQGDGAGPERARKAWGGGRGASVPQTDTGGWVQVHRGGRENLRQGTRQSHPVTSGEGVPLPVYLQAREAGWWPQ
jgi:hypothetical protein